MSDICFGGPVFGDVFGHLKSTSGFLEHVSCLFRMNIDEPLCAKLAERPAAVRVYDLGPNHKAIRGPEMALHL